MVRPLRRLALALLAVSALSGPALGQEPRTGGTLTFGVETEASTLNPHLNTQDKTKLYLRNAYESLLARDAEAGFVPWLAEAYEVSEDGLTYTFTLREGVSFTDGEPLDADAVIANFEKIREEAYGRSYATGPAAGITDLTAVDERTVRFTLGEVYAPFLDFVGTLEIVSPRAFEEETLLAGGSEIAGTGPFVIESYVKGQQLTFSRNADYASAPANAPHDGPAYLDEVIYRFLPESAVRTGALLSGQVDAIEGVSGNDAATFEEDDAFTYDHAFNVGTPYSLFLNAAYGPTQDVNVRKAIGHAIDIDGVLASVYRGQRTRAWGINTPADTQFYDASIEGKLTFDVDLANRLLDEAGWTTRDTEGFRTKDGTRLSVHLVQSQATVRDQRDVLLQAVQAQLRQNAGIELEIEYVDGGTYTERRRTGEYGIISNSNTPTDAVDIGYKYLPPEDGGSHFFSRARNPELKEWLTEAAGTLDHDRRFEIYSRLQDFVVLEEALVVPLYVPEDQIAASADVHGLSFRPFKQLPESAHAVWLDR